MWPSQEDLKYYSSMGPPSSGSFAMKGVIVPQNTMRAGMITQLIPQQLLMCNWCACNWILIPRALLLCNCLSVIS